MKYLGFEICFKALETKDENCQPFYCEFYSLEDDKRGNLVDSFTIDVDVRTASDAQVYRYLRGVIDNDYKYLMGVDAGMKKAKETLIDVVPKEVNPFYNSTFLISREGSDDKRMLVELYEDELVQLRNEIDVVLKNFGHKHNKSQNIDDLISRATDKSKQGCELAEDLGQFKEGFEIE